MNMFDCMLQTINALRVFAGRLCMQNMNGVCLSIR